jgi:RNA-splicing ligase RtcB
VISPGGVGFDINCGVRMLRTNLSQEEIKPHIEDLIQALFYNIPSGLGSEGKLRINEKELDKVLLNGSAGAVEKGFGEEDDLIFTEELKNGDYPSWEHWVQATISWRYRQLTRFTTAKRPGLWAYWRPARS